MEENKLQYVKEYGYVEFDKDEIISELSKTFGEDKATEMANKFKYYRLMSDGEKIFYSEEYIDNHSIDELEIMFNKIS